MYHARELRKRVAQTVVWVLAIVVGTQLCPLLAPLHLSPNAPSRARELAKDNSATIGNLSGIIQQNSQLHNTKERSCEGHGRIQLLLQDPRQDPLLVHNRNSHLCKTISS